MREIKFRAWDGKSMHQVGFLDTGLSDKRFVTAEGNPPYELDGVEIMQYTGLKDKNGVEIYEGDVLQLACGSDDGVFNLSEVKAQVVWNEVGFMVSIPDKKVVACGGSKKGQEVSWRDMHTWVGCHTCLSKHAEYWGKLKIIGNIYQNPELLQ